MNQHLSTSPPRQFAERQVDEGDMLRQAGKLQQAIERYESAAAAVETPAAALCLRLARCYAELQAWCQAAQWAIVVVDHGDDFVSWKSAAAVLRHLVQQDQLDFLRPARAAVLGSYNTSEFAQLLPLAAARHGLRLDVYAGDYGQYRQEILDSASAAYAGDPDFVVIATHEGELCLSDGRGSPEAEIETELGRWTCLWQAVRQHSNARVVQHNFVTPAVVPWGHLATRIAASRYAMTHQLNSRLGLAAGQEVSIVDCERLAAWLGKRQWYDARYWHMAKHAVALQAVPLLARHTAAVMAAGLGLTRKCVVLDLDNTLWGGVIGEDGLAGICLGGDPRGEAYLAFQEYLLRLKEKGVILAVCSKNNAADARLPFEQHPDMRLRLDDFSCFMANWRSKSDNLGEIAKSLDIGVDALVFVDDNPVERAAVRQLVPEVEVIPLPADPALYVETLAQYPGLETASLTEEDRRRTVQYHAKAQVTELRRSAESLEEFQRSLQMKATVGPFDELQLPRIAQLIGKTNQFNLTTRRHSIGELKQMMLDPTCVHRYLRLRDRFADHGLVGVAIAFVNDQVLDIDTLLMSCRVLGRTVEATLLQELCHAAFVSGCTHIRGLYLPTTKNAPVKDLFAQYGFQQVGQQAGGTAWVYDLIEGSPIKNEFIETMPVGDAWHEPTPAT